MRLDRQLVRLMAVMIVMIIAYVTPSAVQAHEGHAHHGGHHQAVVTEAACRSCRIVLAVPGPRGGDAGRFGHECRRDR